MKITQFTDYSLRLLLYLARNRDRVITVREVAEHYEISAEHLKKVVRRLVELGHVMTVRGKHGGLKLGREPVAIDLGQLFRASENLNLLECYDEHPCCPMPDCKLRGLVDQGLRAFLAVLDGKTLAEMV
jgi:Rrf2 family nitric oxide-sensitive transcriptional repressor